jgi:hypothetical protein
VVEEELMIVCGPESGREFRNRRGSRLWAGSGGEGASESGEVLSKDPFLILARHRSQTRLASSPIATVGNGTQRLGRVSNSG